MKENQSFKQALKIKICQEGRGYLEVRKEILPRINLEKIIGMSASRDSDVISF